MTTLLEEIQAKCSQELIDSRDFDAIAAAVNVGRTRVAQREVGKGTILEVLGLSAGNAFLDIIDGNSDFRHVKGLVAEGRLRIDSALVQATIDSFVAVAVLTAEQGAALKALGVTADPVTAAQCAQALDGGA